jgi:hypothetical protein
MTEIEESRIQVIQSEIPEEIQQEIQPEIHLEHHSNPIHNTNITIVKTKEEENVELYINRLNYDIGYHWWKIYFHSAFWNNISTPINLLITILTTITTGHSATEKIVSNDVNTQISIAVLFISLFNTFFRPAQQLNVAMDLLRIWTQLGTDYEKMYYQYKANSKGIKIEEIHKLYNQVNEKKKNLPTNFIIDLLFMLINKYFIKKEIYCIPSIES